MKNTFILVVLLLFQANVLMSCKKTEEPPAVIPELSFTDLVIPEGSTPGRTATISFRLSEATTATVSFKWHTEDGTAKAGEDYTAVTDGVVTFVPGEITASVEVPLISDSDLELDETFYVVLSDFIGLTSNNTSAQVTIENDDSYTAQKVDDGYITPDSYPGMTLIWSDEFNGTTLNTSDWNYEIGGGGWGNNELEIYTNAAENVFVKDGYLTIRATKNPYTGDYYSGRLTTKGKQEFTYGRIDIRARMPIGQGIWPALWMLGANISSVSWPRCGEIDIMEYLGHDSLTTYGTVHYNDGGHKYKGSSYKVAATEDYHNKFHVFTIIWQEGSIQWYVDYHKFFTANSSSIVFDAFNLPQFFIMNVAVGGAWPGYPNETTVFPQEMVVDYVRIFR
jgi:beta-glucanase (GH16 family)